MTINIRLLLALPLFAVLTGCIAFPVKFGEKEPFSDDALAFIEIGQSTKEDIAATMSRPMRFMDGNLWLYARTRREANWEVISLIPGFEGEGTTGNFDYRFLVIRFDDSNVVAGYETSSSNDGKGCNRSGVCRVNYTYMLDAPEEESRAIKQFESPANHCGAYVYGMRSSVVPITLDNRQIGTVFDSRRFIFEQLDPGVHQLKAAYVADGPTEFTCAPGSNVFFEIDTRRRGFLGKRFETEVTQKSSSEGRQAIAKRDWILGSSDST